MAFNLPLGVTERDIEGSPEPACTGCAHQDSTTGTCDRGYDLREIVDPDTSAACLGLEYDSVYND